MTYSLNEQAFVTAYLSIIDEPDEADRKTAEATVQTINRAYYAGLEAGRDSDLLCIDDSGFKLSETMLKCATDDEISILRSICKAIHERSVSNDIK